MNVSIDRTVVEGLRRTSYTCRSFTVRTLSGSNVPLRVWWATTEDQASFVEHCRAYATGDATIHTAEEQRTISLSSLPVEARRVSVPTSDGRMVWVDETDDRWMSHERPPNTVMIVGEQELPLVELRPRHVTKQTATTIRDAVTSEREE